ncbi:peroxiredoxin [Kordiimonas marina]|uniref:peroxiredoxin n=1 Tax=Kordiimonas marina TaxID=2872312 RepID=UPI001FF1987C|nr:peroxiredoxin [Kordiimonas marina]MCJ9429606.1 peroxiredoxin [Kordiimonas marina]
MTHHEDQENDAPTRPIRLNDKAPVFAARTTMGVRCLSDYWGKWLILFSHPADFTPVCTSEFIALEKAADRFRDLDCELLGLSADSIYAHLAWIQNIEERFGVQISFPIIEDLSLAVAEAYGMIDAFSTSTSTIRSAFFIDPEGIVRALIHYPMSVGRSVDEMLRVLAALQATSQGDLATPEGWQPGDKLLQVPPTTVEALRSRVPQATGNGRDWYYVESSK